MAKLTIVKTHTWQNIHLQKQNLAKEAKKKPTNDESLNQTHYSYCEKKGQQTYNVIFIWDKRPNLNPKPNFKPDLKPFLFCINFK